MSRYIIDNFNNFMKDKKGNLGILTVLLLPLLIPVAGIAIDVSSMMNARDKMRDASDAGALAAAKALSSNGVSTDDAKKIVLDFLKAHSPEGSDFSSDANVAITSTGSGDSKVYRVTVDTRYKHPVSSMTRFLGIVDTEVSTKSRAVSGEKVLVQKPLSVFLVLDRSGSMKRKATDGAIKIDALKYAVKEMGEAFEEIDPDKKFIRTGGQAFSSYWVKTSMLNWGSADVVDYVDSFSAHGNTIPLTALLVARKLLVSSTEKNTHLAKNGGIPKKVLIYMTDGQNWMHDGQTDAEQLWIDTEALNRCKAAKDAGIEVYTIGFEINEHTEEYLKKCSSGEEYFYLPSGAGGLIATFKHIGEKLSLEAAPRIAM